MGKAWECCKHGVSGFQQSIEKINYDILVKKLKNVNSTVIE